MIIYPAIDIKNGRVVRLLQGEANRVTEYFEDPAVPAKQWLNAGAAWVHVVDLDGAFSGSPKNRASIAGILDTGLKVQLGGGIRSEADVKAALEAGVSRVVIGTKAIQNPELTASLVRKFGPEIAVGIDARDGYVAVRGWVETTRTSALELARQMADIGVKTLIYTDIGCDGMLTGPNFDAQVALLKSVSCQVIASGGVSRNEDLQKFIEIGHQYSNLDGVIVGKALYEGTVDLPSCIRKLGMQ